jgi:hypothetical protein
MGRKMFSDAPTVNSRSWIYVENQTHALILLQLFYRTEVSVTEVTQEEGAWKKLLL